MNRRYCYSCAALLPRSEQRPAAVCQRCALSGPNTPVDRRRWTVRTVGGGTRGPLSLDALTDQLLRGALGPADLAARRGGRWVPIIEHPDLQSFFLPGNQDAQRLVDSQEDRLRDRRAGDAARVFRTAASIG